MKIIYSPYYGSRPYVNYADRGGVLFGEKAVGSAGLLDELELRTGLSREEMPEMDRLISYVKAMRKALEETPGLFFADSFGNDELGTARVILSWRDTLVMAMWTPGRNTWRLGSGKISMILTRKKKSWICWMKRTVRLGCSLMRAASVSSEA